MTIKGHKNIVMVINIEIEQKQSAFYPPNVHSTELQYWEALETKANPFTLQ